MNAGPMRSALFALLALATTAHATPKALPAKAGENARIIRDEIERAGLSVIIARRACVTYAKLIKEHRREHKTTAA